MATCEFALVPCPNKCEDKKAVINSIMRKDLDKHLEKHCPNRDLKCVNCGHKGLYAHMTKVHDSICEMKRIPCSNSGCTKTIQRRNAKRHLEECDYSEIPCKYQRLGCEVRMRKDMPAHEEDDKLHLHMALDKVISMEEKFIIMKNHMEEDIVAMKNRLKEDDTNILKNGETITFKLTDFQHTKNNNVATIFSTFYSSQNGYLMQVIAYANGKDHAKDTHVSVYASILKGKHDAELKWPFVGNVTIQMLNQHRDNYHHRTVIHFQREDNILVGSGLGYSHFIPHSKLAHNSFKNMQYLKDDTLYFRVSVKAFEHKHWLECTIK